MKRKAADVELESGKKVEQDRRIVRVSRQTGVKDRHSKVLTAQGLRDRRVRLSLPTAFQLYDLQHKLGYEQPSKAVDWLIKAAKSAIDELPVLVPEMASASAGNVAHLTTSISSIVEHCVASSSALTVPLDPQSNNEDNLSGIHTHITPGLDNVQQLWDYNITPSCTDMLCTHDSRPLQNMHSLTEAFQKSFQPVPSISASRHDVIESPCLQSYEMVDSGKQCRHLGVSLEEGRAYIPDMIMKNGEQQQQQQAYLLLNHYTSTLVPMFSKNVNLLTPSLSSSGPVPAFSSSITNVPSLSQTHQNAEGEVSEDAAHDFLPFQECEVVNFGNFTKQGNSKFEHSLPWYGF